MSHTTNINEYYRTSRSLLQPLCRILHTTQVNVPCHTHMKESYHTYEWVMSHVTVPAAATVECVISHVWMCHVTPYEGVISHTWVSHIARHGPCCGHSCRMRHITRKNVPCHKYEWVILHTNQWVTSHITVPMSTPADYTTPQIWTSHVTHCE